MQWDSSGIWRPDRRVVLGGAAATMAAALMPGAGFRRAFATSPRRGGVLRAGFSQGATTDTLDPATYFSDPTYAIGWAFGNNLVELTSKKEAIPELAESWESKDDLKVWTFKLRKDVEFSNGKKLTAADVVYSLNRHLAADSKSAAKGLLQGIRTIRADGNHVVVIEHETGDADIPVIMGDFHLQIIPEGYNDWSTFVGTGPYILDHFDPGVRLEAHRNPNYWKQDRAWFDAIEFTYIGDATARMNALVSGEVDAIDRVEARIVNLLNQNPAFMLVEAVGSSYNTSVMDVRNPSFSDANVREAVKFAVDRKALVKTIYLGFGEVGNDHPVPSNDPFFHKELPQWGYDPDKAKWHLKQAGLSTLALELSTADAAFTGAVDAVVLMREQAKPAGIDIAVKREANDGYWSEVWMKKPFFMSYWGVRPTPGMMFSLAFQCGAPWNESYWCNDSFTGLLKAAKTEADANKRRQMYWDMQEICHKDGGNCIFTFPSTIDGYTKKLAGVEADAVRAFGGARLAERAWFVE